MKRLSLFSLLSLLIALAFPAIVTAQTTPSYCTIANPCTAIAGTLGTDIAATITDSSSGVETAGPALASLYRCQVTSSQTCAASTFSTASGSPWTAVAVTNGQTLSVTQSAFSFYDATGIVWGDSYIYALNLQWVNASGGLIGTASGNAYSAQVTFPAAPAGSPTVPASLTGTPAS